MKRHRKIINFLKNKKLCIDADGRITDILKLHMYATLLYICVYMIAYSTIIVDTLQNVTYCKFTLHATSLYAKFIEYILKLNDVPYYKIYNRYHTNMGYIKEKEKEKKEKKEKEDKEEREDKENKEEDVKNNIINLNPTLDNFIDQEVPLIPLSNQELKALSNHFGISNLSYYQDVILSKISSINAYDIVNSFEHTHGQPINNINNFYIQTQDSLYKTRYVLSDHIAPLNRHDIINASYYCHNDQSIHIEKKYYLNNKYHLVSLTDELKEEFEQLPLYSLAVPRDSLRFHPFHLPKMTDHVMAIFVLTQACIDQL
jgi:hypothetical protein